MRVAEQQLTRCEQCGALLQGDYTDLGCLNCLLVGGLTDLDAESRRFQHYEICLRGDGAGLHELGRGAMGVTYRAIDLNLGSSVALKIIGGAFSENAAARERFKREARTAAQLRHPNVASVFHFGETATGHCFYAMELIEGETLEERVRRGGPLPVSTALQVIAQVVEALVAAEAHGLVHRDLKPGNIMVVAHQRSDKDVLTVKVIDFGLAKAVSTRDDDRDEAPATFSGTPGFASPEQFRGGDGAIDSRSDIYSLGATLWYLLSGSTPGRAEPLSLTPLKRSRVPAPVGVLLRSMLAAEPARRPQTASELLNAVQACRQRVEAKPRRLRQAAAVVATLAVIGLLALTNPLWRQRSASGRLLEKSIAVLPFENLSSNEQDAHFATGVQDEILSNLARIAELKVISRTSVMRYKDGGARDLREIGRALGVAHVVEGSVQRVANRVRINAQLIDARTDTHLWAQTYDRDLADVFAIQSEIASEIANQLRAKLSPAERVAITERPTADLQAYKLYNEAKSLELWGDWKDLGETKGRRVELLKEAIRRDPNFVQAYLLLAKVYSHIQGVAFLGGRYVSEVEEPWKQAIDTAMRLRPDLGEPHVVRARYYSFHHEFDRAREELAIARPLLPNDSEALHEEARVDRRQNRWDAALAKLGRANELDPRNGELISWTCETYRLMRRYREGERFINQAMARMPEMTSWLYVLLAQLKIAEGDLAEAQRILAQVPSDVGTETRFHTALYQHDYAAATQIIATAPAEIVDDIFGGEFPLSGADAQIARARGDTQKAHTAFLAARERFEKKKAAEPKDPWYFKDLALLDAGLGRKEEAIREVGQAVSLVPVAKDSLFGPWMLYHLASVYAWTGERDLAIEQLENISKLAGDLSYGDLRFNPCWDSLRSDPRFEKIVASLAPKAAP